MLHDTAAFTIGGRLATAESLLLEGNASGLTPYDLAVVKLYQSGALRLVLDTCYGGGGTPAEEFYGVVRTWTLMRGPAELDVAALRADLAPGGRLHQLMDRVSAGLAAEYDQRGNWRGTLTDDAAEAETELDRHFEDADYGSGREVWDADEWIGATDIEGLSADTTDEELEALVEDIEAEAEDDAVVLMDTERALSRRRENLRARARQARWREELLGLERV